MAEVPHSRDSTSWSYSAAVRRIASGYLWVTRALNLDTVLVSEREGVLSESVQTVREGARERVRGREREGEGGRGRGEES
eukprot:3037547-Rhodomonas_salina.3